MGNPLLLLAALTTQAPQGAPQEPVVPVADNLIVQGVPPIPRTIAEQVGRYTEFRAAGLQDWHPQRREVLISTRFGNTAQVHRVAMPLGMRKQLTFFPEAVSSAQFNPRDPKSFVFTRDVGGNENFQIYRYDVANGESTLLTDGKSKNEDPVWSPDGNFILYVSSRRTGQDNDFYIVDPRHPSSDHMVLERKGGGWYPMDVAKDGKTAVVLEYKSINESSLHLLNVKSGEIKEIAGKNGDEPVSYGGAEFGPDPVTGPLYYTTDRGGEFQRLHARNLSTGADRVISDEFWDVEAFDVSPQGEIAYVQNVEGASLLYVASSNGKPRLMRGIPTGVMSGLKWSPDGREIGFSLSSAQSSSDVYSINPRTQRLTRWTESETGGLNTEKFVAPELVRWKSFDGREISGFLYRPRKAGKVPVIINIHGGPESQYRPGFLGRTNYYINELGVAVLFPNVRGSSGYGKTFLKLDNGFQREDSYKDIGALLDWIGAQPGLDASKVMVTGGSYGGHMTFAVSYLYPDRIAAALPVVGMSNLVTFLENTSAYRRDLRRVEYGDERDPKMREFLLRIAPLNNASKITRPTFVVQGVNDPRVPYSEATQFVEKIKAINPNVWFLAAKDEGHGFAKKNNADFQFYATVAFIQRFLLGDAGSQ
jgi:dipeptidyl aminopeptidase/acylaminoacyl peptidase